MSRRLFYALAFTVAFILLGVVAWVAGWAAHKLLFPPTLPSTGTPVPAMTQEQEVVEAPVLSPVATATRTPRPTSTLMPSPTLTPTPAVITVQRGEGIYQVCRRHCPGLWPEDEVPESLDEYAHLVAQENGLRWGRRGPRLYEGQELRMPPCPP